jgi:hypothetical protein
VARAVPIKTKDRARESFMVVWCRFSFVVNRVLDLGDGLIVFVFVSTEKLQKWPPLPSFSFVAFTVLLIWFGAVVQKLHQVQRVNINTYVRDQDGIDNGAREHFLRSPCP